MSKVTLESIAAEFRSGNSIPVERATFTRERMQEVLEAYADARVRAALEEAATLCWEMQSRPEFGKDDKDRWLAIAEQRIRALIPKENA